LDYKQDYVCICDRRQSYGLSCGRNTVPNPCLAAAIEKEQYYPFAFSALAFVQCNGELIYVQPCPTGLYWNQDAKTCVQIETSSVTPAQDQSQSYQVTYATGQQQQPSYNRPTASYADQTLVKPRLRHHHHHHRHHHHQKHLPRVLVNDESSSPYGTALNQAYTFRQDPSFKSFMTPSSSMYQSRRVKEQPFIPLNNYGSTQNEQRTFIPLNNYGSTQNEQRTFIPSNNYGSTQNEQRTFIPLNSYGSTRELQQPIITSRSSWTSPYSRTITVDTNQPTQQYGQTYNQQPSRTLVRVIQPESTKYLNRQSTLSGYRR
jgi:hypothetical protein